MKKYNLCNQESIAEDREETAPHGDEQFPCISYLDQYRHERDFFPWHWHDEWEMTYVTQGQVLLFVNDQRILLRTGEGCFINRRALHMFSGYGTAPSVMPNILFQPSLLYGTQDSVYWKKYVQPLLLSTAFSYVKVQPSIPWQAEILHEMEKAFTLLTEEEYGYEFYVREALSKIVLTLIGHMPDLTQPQASRQPEMDTIQKMVAFIHMHYAKPIHVQQIADSALVSRRECLRCFRRVMGTSPIQYVIQLRMRKAKQLLTETNVSILEVGARCGFQDQSYFIKMFREREGVSPAQYRKRGG